jgi:hypothetical protein
VNEVVLREGQEVNAFEMKPKTLEQAMKFCEIMADSTLVPKDYQGKPGNIMVAIQLGQELGLSPMRALKSIAVINGRATVWGDEMLAMVLAHPDCEYVDESESTEKEGVCKVKRRYHPELRSTFSLEDAKRAGLLGKPGPWTQYTPRMLKLRARGFGLRDKFADALAGLVTTEEALDTPAEPTSLVEEAKALYEQYMVRKPETLKDKLRQRLEEPKETPDPPASSAQPVTPPCQDGTTYSEADPALPTDFNPVTEWKEAIRNASTRQAINDIYTRCPDELKPEIYGDYSKAMKGLNKK